MSSSFGESQSILWKPNQYKLRWAFRWPITFRDPNFQMHLHRSWLQGGLIAIPLDRDAGWEWSMQRRSPMTILLNDFQVLLLTFGIVSAETSKRSCHLVLFLFFVPQRSKKDKKRKGGENNSGSQAFSSHLKAFLLSKNRKWAAELSYRVFKETASFSCDMKPRLGYPGCQPGFIWDNAAIWSPAKAIQRCQPWIQFLDRLRR